MKAKRLPIFFGIVMMCVTMLSFRVVRPTEPLFFGLWSDTESLTDLQKTSLERIIKQTIEVQGELSLKEEKAGLKMPASLKEVKSRLYETLRKQKVRYGLFGWLEAEGKSSRLRIFILDSDTETEADGAADYRTRSDIFTAVMPAVENLIDRWQTTDNSEVAASDYVPREWVRIGGGFFKMGENYHKQDNQPQHEVYIDDFWMDPYEVTVREFREFVEETGYYMGKGAFIHNAQMRMVFEKELDFGNPGYQIADRQPVSCVSWIDALHYCNWKSTARGLTPCYEITDAGVRWIREADGYRLPTEAEWEYAASGGELMRKNVFSGSDYIGTVAVYSANSGGKPATVGSLKPNELGLYDMSGNVFEWCWDIYGETFYGESSSNQNNPTGPKEGAFRVYRGGSWLSPPMICLVFNRLSNNPQLRSNLVGFRLVRSGPAAGFDVSR